ncbi:probable xyloglucan endotransglucosylase/hydrolase protein 30 [Panicum virgatum]|uniref:Xyloglucan endotransglucosylase/hydrolase n=1 Tax=Panicum virgatum TaxID=38727 RepID=A0A8T0N5T5_PANVG|nr:probable xyloglucan endotransglucosylase/hydrolase protein 30 [Panicum virgatum]KAG2544415.1 hypothetical protein PVAP13_9KG021100 [Panicum virgatum]
MAALRHQQLSVLVAAAAALLMMSMTRLLLVVSAASDVPTITFDEGFAPLFGEANMERSPDGRTVSLTLNRYSGAGFISSHYYHHGFFSADVRLPKDHTAGVVVAFYLSNGDVFDKNHDELDFEFLGNRRRHEWRLQTNVYGNGSTERGREERYLMPFDPTLEAHRFSILWSSRVVIFYVDGVAVREVPRSGAMGGDYPSKPMALYATIWDGSTWATDNGRYKVNYKRGPFTADFSGLVLRGCPAAAVRRDDPAALQLQLQLLGSEKDDRCAGSEFELMTADYAIMTPRRRMEMRRWRQRQMLYTVCYDTNRYPAPFPECDVNMAERQNFWEWGESKVVRPRVRARSGSSRRRRTAGGAPATTHLVSLQQAD